MSSQIAKGFLQGDPRRPQEVHRYQRPETDKLADAFQEPLLMVGMMLGLGGLLTKVKIMGWLSLFVTMSGLAHAKPDNDLKQLVTSLVFAIMSIVASYAQPMQQAARQAP